jgi:hypothetical protein
MPRRSNKAAERMTASEAPEPARAASRAQAPSTEDLKSREYRDKNGNIHHHTRRYMEQHRGDLK